MEKSELQFSLSCSSFVITRLWNERASAHGRYSSTVLMACNKTDLPLASTLSQVVKINVKQDRNFANPMFSLVTSSLSSSLLMVCGHNNVFLTGLFLIFAPDFTFLWRRLTLTGLSDSSVPVLELALPVSSGHMPPILCNVA